MDTILIQLQNAVAQIKNNQNEIAFRYVDENWGQLDLYGREIPVQWPAVLITLKNADYSNNGRNFNKVPMLRQEGMLMVEFTVANLKLTNSSFKAPVGQKNDAFEIWRLVEELHKAIHGLEINFGKMIRQNMVSVKRDDGVQEVRVVYSLALSDC